MKKTEEKGVTLIALITTIIILLILVSIGTNVGMTTINSANFTQFKNELNILQTKVNELNQNNEKDIGQELKDEQKNILNLEVISDIIYKGKTEEQKRNIKNGFRYCNRDYIRKEFNLDSVNRDYLINIEYRYVIFFEGFEYEGIVYYIIDQIENGLHNVQYKDKNEKVGSFDVDTTKEDDKWKVEISNIQHNGYVDKWQIKYKLEGTSYWETSNDLTFYVRGKGVYAIKVVHGDEIDLGTKNLLFSNTFCCERLEYIQSTGTQYIDTNVLPDKAKIELKFAYNNIVVSSDEWQSPIGAFNGDFFHIIGTNNYISLRIGGGNYSQLTDKYLERKIDGDINNHIAIISNIDSYIKIDDQKDSIQEKFDLTNLGSIYLFARHGGVGGKDIIDCYSKNKLYYCKIWDNNILKRDYIPVLSVEDGHEGEACLFDIVEDKFYYNQGAGKFEYK